MAKDYFKVLGVRKNASPDEIKRAFRRLAYIHHPDRSPDSGGAERMKEINEAYSALKNPVRRIKAEMEASSENKRTGRAAEDLDMKRFFSFSPYEVLSRYGEVPSSVKLAQSAIRGFDALLEGRRFLKQYFVFFKVAERLGDLNARALYALAGSHVKKKAQCSPRPIS